MAGCEDAPHLPACFRAAILSLMDSSSAATAIARDAASGSEQGLRGYGRRLRLLLHSQGSRLLHEQGAREAGHCCRRQPPPSLLLVKNAMCALCWRYCVGTRQHFCNQATLLGDLAAHSRVGLPACDWLCIAIAGVYHMQAVHIISQPSGQRCRCCRSQALAVQQSSKARQTAHIIR